MRFKGKLLLLGISTLLSSDMVLAKKVEGRVSDRNRKYRPILKKWQKRPVTKNAKLKILKGRKAGLPLKSMKVKTISRAKLNKTSVKKISSGLYIVGLDYIPTFTKALLKQKKLRLLPNGKLINAKGKKMKLFIGGETGKVFPQKLSMREKFEAKWDVENKMLDDHPEANFASPYPFRCYSFHPWALYHGGFHRWYEAETHAASYSSDPYGGCSVQSPRTRIEYMQTYVVVTGSPDIDSCRNCDREKSRDVYDIGYFWPAHGGHPLTYHHAVFKDGRIYFSRVARLTW